MSTFIPNSGLRKPLNMLDGPVFPDVRKDGLRFVWGRKHWTVDAGDALRETTKYPFFMDNIIEIQSRNRNQTIYGQSSHRDYVNHQVIMPMISPYDLMPLSRQKSRPVVPRVNPSFPTQVVQTSNLNEFYGYLTDRVGPGSITDINSRPLTNYHPLKSVY
jgi:hypothetical protein